MDKTINLFGDPRVNEVMSATRINEYCKKEFLKKPMTRMVCGVVTSTKAWRDIFGWLSRAGSC